MSTRNRKIAPTDNYFERTRRKQYPKKYRYYFFDYIYYCGEVWGKKSLRMSGSTLLFLYWAFCIGTPLCLFLMQVPEINTLLTRNQELGIAFVFVLASWPFCALRYRAERKMAIMRHYRLKGWGFPVLLVCFGPIIIVLLEVAVLKLW